MADVHDNQSFLIKRASNEARGHPDRPGILFFRELSHSHKKNAHFVLSMNKNPAFSHKTRPQGNYFPIARPIFQYGRRNSCGRIRYYFPSNIKTVNIMSAHIYKKIEIVGSSPNSIEDAVNNAVAKAAESIRNIRWVEVVETRCHVENQKVAYWQVAVKIGFTLDEA